MAVWTFQRAGSRMILRPTGSATAAQLVHIIADGLQWARQQALPDALVDISAMSGFESPDPAFRRWAVRLWAREVRHAVRIAMVARPELICPHKTGLLAAAEEGLKAMIFDNEAPAIAWLDGPSASNG